MDRTAAGLLGAVAGMATVSSAQALPNVAAELSETFRVSSYADLLKPIPNAVEQLKAYDAARATEQPDGLAETIQPAQYYYGYGDPYYAPYPPPPPPYAYYPRYGSYPRYHHHHHHHHYHHHHHHGFYRRY